jgi:hypothetical protein
MTRIYIDRNTGTWGATADLIHLDVPLDEDGIEDLNEMTDNQRIDWAVGKEEAEG